MLNKLERKFGRYAIPHLTYYLIGSYAVAYLVYYILGSTVTSYLALVPALVLRGQVWRLVTWILIPPGGLDLLTFLMLFMFYQFGEILERTWGDFKFNFYIFSGLILTIIGAFVAHFILLFMGYSGMANYNYNTYYVALSIFLAVAACYPEMEVRLYFIIPIKFKWAAAIHVVFLLYQLSQAYRYGSVATVVMIVASLVNFVWVYSLVRNNRFNPRQQAKQAARRRAYAQQMHQARANAGYHNANGTVTKHKCAICGRTELDGAELEFRYCSKCNGNYEYCQDHLFTHEHKK